MILLFLLLEWNFSFENKDDAPFNPSYKFVPNFAFIERIEFVNCSLLTKSFADIIDWITWLFVLNEVIPIWSFSFSFVINVKSASLAKSSLLFLLFFLFHIVLFIEPEISTAIERSIGSLIPSPSYFDLNNKPIHCSVFEGSYGFWRVAVLSSILLVRVSSFDWIEKKFSEKRPS